MKSLKICLLNSSFDCSSATAKIFIDYAVFFAERGHQVTLFFHRRPECSPTPHPGVRICTFPKRLPVIKKGPPEFNPIEIAIRMCDVIKNRYDVIHVLPGHRPSHFLPAILSRKLYGTLLVDEWWEWFGVEGISADKKGLGSFIAKYEQLTELKLKKYYDVILPISKCLADRLPAEVQKKCIVLHGGMDDQKLVAYDLSFARASVNLDAQAFCVGMSNICRLDHPDNIPLFRAFSEFAKQHDHIKLIVSGERTYIDSDVRSVVGEENLVNIGWQPFEKYNLYLSACNLFALPFPDTKRNRGRWPNKLGDYVWLKRPVITNPTGELKEIVLQGNLGYCTENSEKQYLRTLEQAYADWKQDKLPLIDPSSSGLMTVTQRKEKILKIYEQGLAEIRGH